MKEKQYRIGEAASFGSKALELEFVIEYFSEHHDQMSHVRTLPQLLVIVHFALISFVVKNHHL